MEKSGDIPLPGSRRLNLNKSFKLSIRSLLTTCSNEEFSKAFSSFSSAEQQDLLRLYIHVMTSLYESIENAFDSLCLETQVGTTLDTIEQLVEEQSMNPVFSDKTNAGEVGRDLLTAKKNEIQYLTNLLDKAEKQKSLIRAHVELLKKNSEEASNTVDVIEKLRSGILNY